MLSSIYRVLFLPASVLLSFSCVLVVSISATTDNGTQIVAGCVDEAFAQYMHIYNKSYAPGSAEHVIRLKAFKESLRRIERANSGRNRAESAIYGLTRYSDLTPEEFRNLFSVFPHKRAANLTEQPRGLLLNSLSVLSYPPRFDWRARKVITPVRNQRNCGACWAFSTIECIETMNALKTGSLTELSVQQMIDCSNTSNHGCSGGDTCTALEWLKTSRVQLVESSVYPFTGTTGQCLSPPSAVQVRLDEYTCSRFVGNEDIMLGLLATRGPLVAAVDAATWQDYLGGIIQYHCEAGRNHAVQIVGYDATGDVPHYIVRNSWGTSFGDDGYLYVAVGKNLCGIAEEVSTVAVAGPPP